jgi:hypothetical protein
MIINTQQKTNMDREARTINTRLAEGGLTRFNESFWFYSKFVLVCNLVFQNPPLRQAWELYASVFSIGDLETP